MDNDIDLLGINETWLDPGDVHKHVTKDIKPTGYNFVHTPRVGRGGGNAIVFKNSFDLKLQSSLDFKSFEYMECLLKSNGSWLRIVVVYRPPPSSQNKLTAGDFFEEFPILLEKLATASGELIMIGDFNFHVESGDSRDALKFLDILDNFGLKQHVDRPTHKSNHTLDLVITRCTECIITDLNIFDPCLSDHKAILFKAMTEKPKFLKKTIHFRNWKNFDMDAFKDELCQSDLTTLSTDNVTSLVCQYNAVLSELVEKHAPLQEKSVTVRPKAPWYTSKIDDAKRSRRRLEHKWLKSSLTVDWLAYKEQSQVVNDMIFTSKQTYYNDKVDSASGDQRSLFKIIDNMFHKTPEPQLPSHDSLDTLVNQFADFFVSKINKIRHEIKVDISEVISSEKSNEDIQFTLDNFAPATLEEVRKLIIESSCKSGPADPVPTKIIKMCIGVLAPIITAIINLSLSSGEIPDNLKEAILSPLIKKACLDPEIFNNFRPISNLSYISKLIEKVVANRLDDHMVSNGIHEIMQSSYKKFHSTETALTTVQDDFLMAVDKRKAVLLLMLDLSAAFDTVDHDILINRLKIRLGIGGTALKWFQSYLTNRKFSVRIKEKSSKFVNLNCGVPQGSVLGPILFTVYTLPLGDIIRKHDVPFHLYADDSQKYAIFELEGYARAVSKIETLVSDIRAWYSNNMLKCNDPKTEMMIISSKFTPVCDTLPVKVGDVSISAASKIRNLGVIMDKHLSMDDHISHILKTAILKIREISYYRRFLTTSTTKTLIHAYVTSRLDYCNGLLCGLPKDSINRLQRILNTAARLVTLTRKYDSITPILRELHWLPVEFRIQYKIILQVFKALNNMAPVYLKDKLKLKRDNGLRSDKKNILYVPTSRLKSYGDRAFSYAGPRLWNALPAHLRLCSNPDKFKKDLKTFLFKTAFNEN